VVAKKRGAKKGGRKRGEGGAFQENSDTDYYAKGL